MLDRAIQLARQLAQQFLSAAVWRVAMSLPLWWVIIIAAACFLLAIL